MELLKEKSNELLRSVTLDYVRPLADKIDWNWRFTGIVGARGSGKTTLLLQQMKRHTEGDKALYISLDDIYFTQNSLSDLIRNFRAKGGSHLYIDEVHKYSGWSKELKNSYDFYKDLHIYFTGSSIIDILKQDVDLSRRALIYELPGLSFREFLLLTQDIKSNTLSIEDILNKHREISRDLIKSFKPLQHLSTYLKYGHYPYFIENIGAYHRRLEQVVRLVIESDISFIQGYDPKNARSIYQLLYILATNVPFKPNVSKISEKIGIHRQTLIQYLHFLEKARLISNLYPAGISISTLQKPAKVYLNNTNLSYALAPLNTQIGTLRETFFINQVSYGHQVSLPKKGDFMVNDHYIFEVGGRQKSAKQIENLEHAYIVSDDIETSIYDKIPLWLFGFLY